MPSVRTKKNPNLLNSPRSDCAGCCQNATIRLVFKLGMLT